jgi:hypothetical protein
VAYRKEKRYLDAKHKAIKEAPEKTFQGLILPNSIVWHYIVKGKRKYSQLSFK